jgi:hypothetical protein
LEQKGSSVTTAQNVAGAAFDADLWEPAAAVLTGNDAGGWTKAAPQLYPHQWSWDSAFIAIGWSHLDLRRAMTEQDRLFAAQWATGMVPHIVFDDTAPAGSYSQDIELWGTSVSPDAPAGPPYTSGLCQPPVHALALESIWERARDGEDAELREETVGFLRRMFPKVLAWHRYLATARDPEESGLVSIYHPWEGADNSPRWDAVMNRLEIGELPPYKRRDTNLVADSAQRPSDRDYDRYLWLVELLKRVRYDDAAIQRDHPFVIKDVFCSAVLVAANQALLRLCPVVGATEAERELIAGWVRRGGRGLAARFDAELQLCLDYDVRDGQDIRCRTFAGFAPLIAGTAEGAQRTALLARLDSSAFLGNPGLRWPLLASTSPEDPAFESRNYWRGPTWPVVNWLLWRALRRDGDIGRADLLRRGSLDQITATGFYEYFDPLTGEPLGSPEQSWTAAVVLDWLAAAPEISR